MNWRVENILTITVTTIFVLGLYKLSGSFHSLWGLLFLLNLNYPTRKKGD